MGFRQKTIEYRDCALNNSVSPAPLKSSPCTYLEEIFVVSCSQALQFRNVAGKVADGASTECGNLAEPS